MLTIIDPAILIIKATPHKDAMHTLCGVVLMYHRYDGIYCFFTQYDSENNDSGQKISKSNCMTKKGVGALRRTLFIIMQVLLQNKPVDNPVYDFLIKKQLEGKHYYSYMNAAANKFLCIYYARVKEVLIDAEASA